jgi:hypothetical protein
MSREAIEALVDRWMNDPVFRATVRKDPEAAVRGTGLELTADEWAALRVINWDLSDEELSSRASKGVGCFCGDGGS